MAGGARRQIGIVVVEQRRYPSRSLVADEAILRRLHVVARLGGRSHGCGATVVTQLAGNRSALEHAIDVAALASRVGM